MSSPHVRLSTLILIVFFAPAAHAFTAQPEHVLPRGLEEDLRWSPQPLAAPLKPSRVGGLAPFVPEGTRTQLGTTELAEGESAAFWLPPLEVVRVSAERAVRFVRVPEVHPGESELRLEESGIAARKNEWYLAEPPGRGSVWLIVATAPVRIQVSRPEERTDALGGEATRARLLSWIDGEGERPPLTFLPQLRAELSLAEELERVLVASSPTLAPAARAWRKAAALHALTRWQPLRSGTWRRQDLPLQGEPVKLNESDRSTYLRLSEAKGSREVELTGPGVLSVRIRPVIGESGHQPRRLMIKEGPRVLLDETVQPQPAWEREESESAFPQLATPRLLSTGERLGIAHELRVSLREGRHRYQLAWEGGELLVRGESAQRKRWTREVLRKTGSASAWARDGWTRLGGDASPASQLLRSMLVGLEPGLSPNAPGLTSAPEKSVLQVLVELERARRGGSSEGLEKALLAVEGPKLEETPLLAWELRLRTAQALIDRSAAEEAQRVLSRAPSFPESGWMAMRAAALIHTLPVGMPLRSRELAALELAWRREPLSPTIRTQYLLAWSRASRWKLLGAQAPQRWMDLAELGPGEQGGAGVLHRLEPGTPVRIASRAKLASAPSLLRAYVVFSEGSKSPATLRIGDRKFRFEPWSRVEPVELALPAGTHRVSLEGEAGVHAYLTEAPEGGSRDPRVAYIHTHWPLRAGDEPVRYDIPDAKLPSPIRISLRGIGDSTDPVELWMHTDVAPPRKLVLRPAPRGDRHFDLQSGAPASSPASVVAWLPPLAREVWFTATKGSRDRAVAGVSVRQDDLSKVADVYEAGTLTPEAIARIHGLSRALKAQPDSPNLLLDRAEALLSVSEESLARADLARLLDVQESLAPDAAQRLAGMLERVSSLGADRVSFTTPLASPALLSPGSGALDGANANTYRTARALLAKGRTEEGILLLAELYGRTRLPELGLETLTRLEPLLARKGEARDRLAPIARLLTVELSAWGDVPSLRRIRALALASAKWQRLQEARFDAGLVHGLRSRGDTSATEALRKAVLASPWALEEGRLLSAGDAMVLALKAPTGGGVTLETLCDALTRPIDRCEWSVRVDGKIVERRTSERGEALTLEIPLQRGAHQVELMLGRAHAMGLVRHRLVGQTQAESEGAVVPLVMTRSRTDAPAVIEVFGPTAIRVRARAVSPGADRALGISWRPIAQGPEHAETMTLALPQTQDASIRAERFAAGGEVETTVLITSPGAHELRLVPNEGEVLLQMDLAVPAEAPPSTQTLWAASTTGLEPLPWPALPAPLSLLPPGAAAGPADTGLGTISPELSIRAEEFGEGEIVSRPPRTGLELRLGLRRQLSEDAAWLKIEPRIRLPESIAPVMGLDAALFLARLPGKFRTQVTLGSSTQRLEADQRFSLRGSLFVDRPLRLTSDWVLLPGATFTAESFHGTGGNPDLFDRDVLWKYGTDHPRRLSPSLSLRWTPLQDQIGKLGVSATSNSDFQSLDHVTGRVGWGSLLGGPKGIVRASLGYEASWRLQDEHRSEDYLRHGIAAQLDWALWNFTSSRLLFFAEDRLLWSAPLGMQNVFTLGIRFDFSGGRGLRDLLPFEEEFEQLLDPARSGH